MFGSDYWGYHRTVQSGEIANFVKGVMAVVSARLTLRLARVQPRARAPGVIGRRPGGVYIIFFSRYSYLRPIESNVFRL